MSKLFTHVNVAAVVIANPRTALYIAALYASKHHEAFKAFCKRLEDKGKTPNLV